MVSFGGQTLDADLSSTLFAVGALRVAGVGADDPAIRKALAFVAWCQNFAGEGRDADPACDDGEFFFTPTESLVRQRDRRYGVRALLRCGLPADHPRVVAARHWLARSVSARVNPGTLPRADGTWINPVGASTEDDPLVATPLTTGAMALSREALPR